MEVSFQKTTALLLGLGSLLFLIAAFLPYSRVFAEPDSEKKMAIILEMRKMWIIGQVLFGLGALITAFALGMLSYGFKEIPHSNLSNLGVILMVIGAILWCWSVTERAIIPEAFVNHENTRFLFPIYSLFTQAGLILIGLMLLKSSVPAWIGWMFIIGAGLFFILMIIFRDMPPFVYYVLTMIAAVAIYFKAF